MMSHVFRHRGIVSKHSNGHIHKISDQIKHLTKTLSAISVKIIEKSLNFVLGLGSMLIYTVVALTGSFLMISVMFIGLYSIIGPPYLVYESFKLLGFYVGALLSVLIVFLTFLMYKYTYIGILKITKYIHNKTEQKSK